MVRALDSMQGTILPSSHRKINQCKALFDKYMDTNTLVGQLEAVEAYSAAAGGGRWRLGGGGGRGGGLQCGSRCVCVCEGVGGNSTKLGSCPLSGTVLLYIILLYII